LDTNNLSTFLIQLYDISDELLHCESAGFYDWLMLRGNICVVRVEIKLQISAYKIYEIVHIKFNTDIFLTILFKLYIVVENF